MGLTPGDYQEKEGMNRRGGFRFIVEEVFAIPGRGVAVRGRVESGTVFLEAEAEFLGREGKTVGGQVIGIEVSRHMVDEAEAGQPATLLLEGIYKAQITPGIVLQEGLSKPSPPIPFTDSPAQYIPRPSGPSFGDAIHPSSSPGRIILLAIIGLLVILAIYYWQRQ